MGNHRDARCRRDGQPLEEDQGPPALPPHRQRPALPLLPRKFSRHEHRPARALRQGGARQGGGPRWLRDGDQLLCWTRNVTPGRWWWGAGLAASIPCAMRCHPGGATARERIERRPEAASQCTCPKSMVLRCGLGELGAGWARESVSREAAIREVAFCPAARCACRERRSCMRYHDDESAVVPVSPV